ncbi:MAG: hypothetical protein D6718_04735 [Acidobacteria bacterium]|nr:MAG: hypothetical protein D6718_04735 [Acidobacteriota bacterium]
MSAALLGWLAGQPPAKSCADCKFTIGDPDHPEFGYMICFDNPELPTGYLYCLTVGDRTCFFFGRCGSIVAREPALAVEMTFYELGGGDLRPPGGVIEAEDVASIATAIAHAAGTVPADVRLGGHAFLAGPARMPADRSGALVARGAGVLIGAAAEPGGAASVVLCTYSLGSPPRRAAEALLDPGRTLIAPLPVAEGRWVVAVRAYTSEAAELAGGWADRQERFALDVRQNRRGPPLELRVAEAPGGCEP